MLKVRVTGQQHEVAAFVAGIQANMKEPWLLATSLRYAAARIVALYGRRFTCEENFRDEKDPRFGLGSRLARIRNAGRRDRLCFILAAAATLLTLLGAAGEGLGMDRLLRANTVKRRTHSLFRQGREYLRDSACLSLASLGHTSPRFPAHSPSSTLHQTYLCGDMRGCFGSDPLPRADRGRPSVDGLYCR